MEYIVIRNEALWLIVVLVATQSCYNLPKASEATGVLAAAWGGGGGETGALIGKGVMRQRHRGCLHHAGTWPLNC